MEIRWHQTSFEDTEKHKQNNQLLVCSTKQDLTLSRADYKPTPCWWPRSRRMACSAYSATDVSGQHWESSCKHERQHRCASWARFAIHRLGWELGWGHATTTTRSSLVPSSSAYEQSYQPPEHPARFHRGNFHRPPNLVLIAVELLCDVKNMFD